MDPYHVAFGRDGIQIWRVAKDMSNIKRMELPVLEFIIRKKFFKRLHSQYNLSSWLKIITYLSAVIRAFLASGFASYHARPLFTTVWERLRACLGFPTKFVR